MTELEKLITDVKSTVAINQSMEDAFEQKAIELKEKCIDNYNKIIKDTFDSLHKTASELCYTYGVFFNTDEQIKTKHVLIKYYGNQDSTRFYVSITTERFLTRPYFMSGGNDYSDDLKNIYRVRSDKEKILAWAEVLSTEDKAYSLLAEIKETYALLFEKVLKEVETKNEGLAEKLKAIEEYLKSSSAITEDEDGTIKIHLNGKTYKGTLVEE